jgi:membrane protease subunit (stomatin/prohibitin family)
MSIWNTLTQHAKSQFLEVIEWLDSTNDTIVYRFPVFNQKITDNSKLVVREGQAAVFISEGQLSDVFGPGTYTLDTRNTPIMSFFASIAYKLNYPYKGDVYFVNTKLFRENRWGTANPFMMRDAEFGPVRVRAFGIYAFRVTDPATFLRQVVGTDGLFTTEEINGQLKREVVSGLATAIGQARIPVLDLAANYMDLGDTIRDKLNPRFVEQYGITLTSFTIENISLPPEVEQALDTRSKMGVLGDLNAYAKLKAADAIQTAAANPGIGGAGIGMGVGFGMGNMMGGMMGQAMTQPGGFNPHAGMQGGPAPAPPPLPQEQRLHYSGPAGQAQLTPAEIAQRVAADRAGNHMVWAAGWPSWRAWTDVPEVAGLVPPVAAAPPPPPGAAARFHYHGPAGQGEKTVAEIVAAVRAEPGAAHNVWKAGFDGWKSASDVPEIAAALAAGPPPPPPSSGPPPLP